MKVGDLVMYTKGDNKSLIGSLGIAIEEYFCDDLDQVCFRVLWLKNNIVGKGWSANSWGMEVL